MRIRLGDLEDSDEEEAKTERASQFKFNLASQVEGFRMSTGGPKVEKQKAPRVKKVRSSKKPEYVVGKSPRSQSADASR